MPDLDELDKARRSGMAEEIEVGMGNLKVASSPDKLVARGIGSCLVITFYDPRLHMGALAHTMLPDSRKAESMSLPAKYAGNAIEIMIEKMTAMGSRLYDIEAKIVGGANMFPNIEHENAVTMIGEENIETVKKN